MALTLSSLTDMMDSIYKGPDSLISNIEQTRSHLDKLYYELNSYTYDNIKDDEKARSKYQSLKRFQALDAQYNLEHPEEPKRVKTDKEILRECDLIYHQTKPLIEKTAENINFTLKELSILKDELILKNNQIEYSVYSMYPHDTFNEVPYDFKIHVMKYKDALSKYIVSFPVSRKVYYDYPVEDSEFKKLSELYRNAVSAPTKPLEGLFPTRFSQQFNRGLKHGDKSLRLSQLEANFSIDRGVQPISLIEKAIDNKSDDDSTEEITIGNKTFDSPMQAGYWVEVFSAFATTKMIEISHMENSILARMSAMYEDEHGFIDEESMKELVDEFSNRADGLLDSNEIKYMKNLLTGDVYADDLEGNRVKLHDLEPTRDYLYGKNSFNYSEI